MKLSPKIRRALVLAATASLVLTAQIPGAPSAGAATAVTAGIDFGAVAQSTTPFAAGIGSSTYASNPISSPAQATIEKALDARYIRVPVGIRGGTVSSSAGGAGNVDMTALVAKYRSWGYHILAVIGGRTNDFDVQPGDATRIMTALGFDGVEYTSPNEPNNMGKSVQDVMGVASMIVQEGRALKPGFTLWGPVWSYYDRGAIKDFAQRMGAQLGGVDYHHYGMGSNSISTPDLLNATPDIGNKVRDTRTDLGSLGASQKVDVDEVNLSWRYQDGTTVANGGDGSGGNKRFFTAINTVFIASSCGHIMLAGGNCLPYATQNGPLGMIFEPGQINPDGRPASSPMPGYWGLAAWTGAQLWPHMKDSFYSTTSTDPNLEVFAVNNEAGGKNLVLINKSTTDAKSLTATLKNVTAGTFTTFQSNPAAQYDAPAKIGTGSYTNAVSVSLPAMTVTVVTLKPAAGPTGRYRIVAGENTVSGYQTPGSLVVGGTASSNSGSTVPPSGVPAAVFQAERWGSQTYTLAVPANKPMKVRLLFAERYPPAQKVGGRLFNVTVNGTSLANNFDIWSKQGQQVNGYASLTSTVTSATGKITVSLANGAAGSPTINAILVDPAS